MRLIDADALAEKKFQERECNGLGEGPAYRQGWNDAIDAVMDNEPSAQPESDDWSEYSGKLWKAAYERGKKDAEQPEWIPTSKKLPKINQPVLVWTSGDYWLAELHLLDDVFYWDFDTFDLSGDEFNDVIAWMPLPKPYKEGK